MARDVRSIVVVGHGAAGLTAALAAAEYAHELNAGIDITLVEKAAEDEAGGNTRWSPSYMRMAAPDHLAPEFENDVQQASGGRADSSCLRTLANHAVDTVQWLQSHGVAFATPIYYLSVGPPRIQPVGAGAALLETLSRAVKRAGVNVKYGCAALRLVADDAQRIRSVTVGPHGEAPTAINADAVVLATGGFQGNPEMMDTQFGPRARTIKLIAPGTRFDTGDGIRLASEIGATTAGDWNGMHAEPIDPRSSKPAPVVLVYPYGLVVDQSGQRFFDEGGGLVHETWEAFARDIHFSRPRSIAYAILDSRVFDIPGVERAIRSDVAPHQADTIEGLAVQIGIPTAQLRQTVDTFNAAATGDATTFDPTRCDGLATSGDLRPAKSNWARAIATPPYFAYPLVGAIAYTFGGLACNAKAEVLRGSGVIPGLYAAGEISGQFYGTAPNAVSMLRAVVFGKIAGQEAVRFVHTPIHASGNQGDIDGSREQRRVHPQYR